MQKKLRGLFLNTEKAICSIYESGKMSFECLKQSSKFSLDYIELSSKKREINLDYDFYVFNYHWVQMGWLDTKYLKQIPGFKITIVLEMSQNSPFDCVSPDDFDAYLVLDPTCKHFSKNVYSFPRPLEVPLSFINEFKASDVPIIGTFGLSFADKGFDEVVKAVNKEFESALIRINVPKSDHATILDVEDFKAKLTKLNIKNSIKIEITDIYFNKEELINWCSQNLLNVFLYNRRIGNGLSATTDQAIASGRPLAVSTNPTFRHIHTYIKPYPYLSLKESIETSIPSVKKIQEDWSSRNFLFNFESMLSENNVQPKEVGKSLRIKLPQINNIFSKVKRIGKLLFSVQGILLLVPPIFLLIRNKILKSKNNFELKNGDCLQSFTHQALSSFSQYQEDLLIDHFFASKKKWCICRHRCKGSLLP